MLGIGRTRVMRVVRIAKRRGGQCPAEAREAVLSDLCIDGIQGRVYISGGARGLRTYYVDCGLEVGKGFLAGQKAGIVGADW